MTVSSQKDFFYIVLQSTSEQKEKVKEVQTTVKVLIFYLNFQPSLMNLLSILN